MAIKAASLRKDVENIIDDQPIMVYRYVLVAGDGVDTGNSWQASGSWRGRRDQIGRNVWFTRENVLGEASQRVYVLLLPWTAHNDPLSAGDRIELNTINGASLGVFLILWVDAFYDSSGNVWKVECNIESYQG